ncbi:MAG: MFS transporter [Coriobacteriales bacterium]|nr:MFS transporter [Coriobacteriales bacterium]
MNTSTNISKRIDALPMTPSMRKILLLVGIGWLFDAMDQGMVSGVIASIGVDWALSPAQLGLLGSAGMVGMILGAALSGIAADRWGRRTVILATLVLFGTGSALCGLAGSYEMLLVCRFITGFGLGGELPAASTLVSELSPLAKRGRNVIILESFWAWGWIIAALVAYLAIPLYGWRVAFLIGAVPALFAAVLRFAVPESPRYLELCGRHAEADRLVATFEAQAGIIRDKADDASPDAPTKSPGLIKSFGLLWSRRHIRSTFVLWVLWFAMNLGYYGFVLWTPSLLMMRGFDMVRSFEFTLIMCVAQIPGYFVAALLVEKIGRKPVLTIFLAGTALAAWFFGQSASVEQTLAFGCLLYFFALGAWGCVYSYSPELYSTDIRGVGTGWAAAFGRVGALIAPMIVPALYAGFGEEAGFTAVFIILMLVFFAAALVVAIFGKETKGIALQDE